MLKGVIESSSQEQTIKKKEKVSVVYSIRDKMAEVVKLSLALGALGLRKLGEHEEVMEILKFGLSFICPDEILVRQKQKS